MICSKWMISAGSQQNVCSQSSQLLPFCHLFKIYSAPKVQKEPCSFNPLSYWFFWYQHWSWRKDQTARKQFLFWRLKSRGRCLCLGGDAECFGLVMFVPRAPSVLKGLWNRMWSIDCISLLNLPFIHSLGHRHISFCSLVIINTTDNTNGCLCVLKMKDLTLFIFQRVN